MINRSDGMGIYLIEPGLQCSRPVKRVIKKAPSPGEAFVIYFGQIAQYNLLNETHEDPYIPYVRRNRCDNAQCSDKADDSG
jgi:hypothetical protein